MSMPDHKPFSMSRMLSVFHCEAEAARAGNCVYLWEPLHYTHELTEHDKPRWDDQEIVFYRPEQKDRIHVNRHLMFRWGGDNTVLILPNFPRVPAPALSSKSLARRSCGAVTAGSSAGTATRTPARRAWSQPASSGIATPTGGCRSGRFSRDPHVPGMLADQKAS
jgi:hypothetical protein